MQLLRKKNLGINESARVLNRTLGVKDLTGLGIAAIVGAGIYGTIGNASAQGGPAVVLLFVFTALACLLSAICYAEFASLSPEAGSAYNYAYVAFGEIVAWIIGWDLVMEYAIGNIAVSISWSDYFTSFLDGLGFNFPKYLSLDYFSAYNAYQSGLNHEKLSEFQKYALLAWKEAPTLGSLKIIFDLPALTINLLITTIVYIGIQESKKTSNFLVLFKLAIIILFILIGFFYVRPQNWIPFAPNGFQGVMQGVSAVFFAYIGFDAISTTAEECIHPQRDLPKAMFYALGICTLLYVFVTLVLTGMVSYDRLGVGDPLALVFEAYDLHFLSGIIALSALVSLASVLLVFQLGQPRIWMSMSRDGLLPPIFSAIHSKYKTPWFSTIVTGLVVALPAMFMNLQEVTDLCSIGTLFAFVIVCAGILVKQKNHNDKGFKVPYISGKYWIPIISIVIIANYGLHCSSKECSEWLTWNYIPTYFFIFIILGLSILGFLKSLSLLPVLGIYINLYLMTGLNPINWLRFGIWLGLGLLVYFTYSKFHSKLRTSE